MSVLVYNALWFDYTNEHSMVHTNLNVQIYEQCHGRYCLGEQNKRPSMQLFIMSSHCGSYRAVPLSHDTPMYLWQTHNHTVLLLIDRQSWVSCKHETHKHKIERTAHLSIYAMTDELMRREVIRQVDYFVYLQKQGLCEVSLSTVFVTHPQLQQSRSSLSVFW